MPTRNSVLTVLSALQLVNTLPSDNSNIYSSINSVNSNINSNTESYRSNSSLLLEKGDSDACKYMTVGDCNYDYNSVIDVYDIPNDDSQGVALCQQVCQIYENSRCNYFSYNAKTEKCTISHNRYLWSCQTVGGASFPTIESCIQGAELKDCDSFVKEDCTFLGKEVYSNSSVSDADYCQMLLVAFGGRFGAEYFRYDAGGQSCTFYDAKVMTCQALNGPAQPNYDDCSSHSRHE